MSASALFIEQKHFFDKGNEDDKEKKSAGHRFGKIFSGVCRSCINYLSGIQYITVYQHDLLQLYRLYRYESKKLTLCWVKKLYKSF